MTGAAIVLIDDRTAATIVSSGAKSAADIGMDTVAIVNIVVAIAATATVTTTRTTCFSCSFANFSAVIRKVGGFSLRQHLKRAFRTSSEQECPVEVLGVQRRMG